jgi:hypothetical protein
MYQCSVGWHDVDVLGKVWLVDVLVVAVGGQGGVGWLAGGGGGWCTDGGLQADNSWEWGPMLSLALPSSLDWSLEPRLWGPV